MTRQELEDCKALAKKIRFHCLQMVWNGQIGNIGSMLSTADIYPVLYKKIDLDYKNKQAAQNGKFHVTRKFAILDSCHFPFF